MFSTTTMESSTRRPSAISMPTIVSWFSEYPNACSAVSPIASDNGIEIITMSEDLPPSGSNVISTRPMAMRKSSPSHAGREPGGEAVHLVVDLVAYRSHRDVRLLVRGHEHRAATVEAGAIGGVGVAPTHPRDIADADQISGPGAHDRAANFIERLVAARAANTERLETRFHAAAGDVGALAADRLEDRADGEPELCQTPEVHFDGHLALGRAPALSFPHAGERGQAIFK